MKKLTLLLIGNAKNSSYKDLETDYITKIKRYVDLDVVVLKDSTEKDIPLKKKKESEKILEKIQSKDCLVLCDEHGKDFTSVKFSGQISKWMEQAQNVVFLIGGAYGVDDTVKSRANATIKLSHMTLPHELARVVLTEQLYRAMTIARGEKYHH